MCCEGDSEGEELVISELDLKIDFKPGDLSFFQSAISQHCILPFEGNELVYFFQLWVSTKDWRRRIGLSFRCEIFRFGYSMLLQIFPKTVLLAAPRPPLLLILETNKIRSAVC